MKRMVAVFVSIFLLSGCVSVQTIRLKKNELPPKLKTDASVYIGISPDGSFSERVYTGSGKRISLLLASALSRYLSSVEVAEGIEKTAEGLSKAKAKGLTYYVSPLILHWEDRTWEWPGIVDKMEVKIVIYNSATGDTVDSVVLRGNGGWSTLAAWGGEHPEDLFEKSIKEYVDSLFAY